MNRTILLGLVSAALLGLTLFPADIGPFANTLAAQAKRDKSFFVAVGYACRHLISYDGMKWEHDQQLPNVENDKDYLLRGMTSGKGLVVAVGGSKTSRILTTTDGKDWTDRSVVKNFMGDVAFGNDMFLAVGYQRSMASRDGVKWDEPVANRAASWRRIVFGNGRFVAIGLPGEDALGYAGTTTDGAKWINTKIADEKTALDIAFGNGRFVIVGTDGLRESSKDGMTWEHRMLGEKDERIGAVIWAGNRFVAAGSRGTYTSPDGIEWKKLGTRAPSTLCYGNNIFVGCSSGSMSYSKDAINWTPAESGKGKTSITKIIFVDGR